MAFSIYRWSGMTTSLIRPVRGVGDLRVGGHVLVLVEMARARAGREEWQKRVQQWKDSGLTAKEFAAETGINAETLQFWRYKLRHGGRRSARTKTKAASDEILASLVEVHAPTVVSVDQRFEIELGNGRRLRVGGSFDAAALRALIAVLEAA